MALNWFLTLRNLAKTDAKAAEIMEQLKTAETDDEKETAKQIAQKYVQELESNTIQDATVGETDSVVAESTGQSDILRDETTDETDSPSDSPSPENKKALTDLSAPAFNPRLAKCGITREEELFLHGVFVRKMTREDKLLMRRSIYQKKTLRNTQIQAEYKQKRIEQKEKDANDPVKQKFHQERKYITAIVDALNAHCNLGWIFNNIEGLTPDIVREFLKNPGYVNAFRQANPAFVDNFKKRYGA